MPGDKKPSAGSMPSAPRQPLRRLIRRAMAMLCLGGALVLAARLVSDLPCWSVFIVTGMLAWPIWLLRTEYRLFHRRLLLAGVIQPGSRIRSLLWKGTLVKIVQSMAALLLAWLLLALVAQMSAGHSYALVLDAVLLALVIFPLTRGLTASVEERHRGVVARLWPLALINTTVLTAAIMWLDFAIVGTVDTRQLAWNQVAEQAFNAVNDAAECILWGISGGVVAAIEALSWHVSTLVIPGLPNIPAQLAAWTFFLLRAVTVAYLFTTLLLGIDIHLERRERRAGDHSAGSTFSRAFLLTIIILAAPFYYASVRLGELDFSTVPADAGDADQWSDPCEPSPASRMRLQAQLDADIEATRVQARRKAGLAVNRELERIFADIRAGVDGYLDWYFTVSGEYQRLATAFTEDTAAAMREQLEQHLFAGSDFSKRLVAITSDIDRQSADRFASLAPTLAETLGSAPCETGSVDLAPLESLERDKLKASIAATSGIGAGIVTSKALASKTVAAVAGKVAAKTSLKGGAAIASKTLAKKGSSALLSAGAGTALCAPTGPFAVLCGITAGAVTWLTVDKILVEADEAFNREDMRADILQELAEQQAVLSKQLIQHHNARIDGMAVRLDATVQRSFIPYTDGIEQH